MAADPLLKLLPPASFSPVLQAEWPRVRAQLLAWHAQQGRHALPWITTDPYGVWLSEVMLQQTQVSTGLVRYPAWLAQFPTIATLAAASVETVLIAWEGLGYYARARNLHRAAQQMVAEHGGAMPLERAARLALPGIGPSTASAIGAFAFGQPEAIFDGNVRRVWGRYLATALPEPLSHAARDRWLWSYAQAVMPTAPAEVRAWTQAIMDLGATVCTPKAPRCDRCPLAEGCRGRASGDPTAFPPVKARTAVQEWPLAWLWVRQGDRVAALERPTPGVWGGLWALPEGEPDQWPAVPAAQGTQVLSHRKVRWRIHPAPDLPANAIPAVTWLTRSEWEAKPWPRALRQWWTALTPTEQDAWWA
jgi:A/G-specific adenine glycosylase